MKNLFLSLKRALKCAVTLVAVALCAPAFGQVVDYGFVSGSHAGTTSNYTLVFPAAVSTVATPRVKYVECIGTAAGSVLQMFGGTALTKLTLNSAVTTTNIYVGTNAAGVSLLSGAVSNSWVVIQSATNLNNVFAYQVWTNQNLTNIVLATSTLTNHNIGDVIYLMGNSNQFSVGTVTNRWSTDMFASRRGYPLVIRAYGAASTGDIINSATIYYDPN